MNTRPLAPFGVEVNSPTPIFLDALSIVDLKALVSDHRLVVLRGFTVGSNNEMLGFCRQLGEILEWQFGSVNELQVRPDAKNYLYTERAVPMHWDGAFVGRVPHYIFFHCLVAPSPGDGGETTFCDTTKLLQQVDPETRMTWDQIVITYSTEKIVHYGGSFTARLVGRHPVDCAEVIRYAEPVDDLNPVRLAVDGIPTAQIPAFLEQMRKLVYDPNCLFAHSWRQNDIVIADNHALLHGRRAFTRPAARHLRRVNVL